MPIFLFLSLLIAAVAVIFALQNTAIIQITFLFWTFEGSLALVLLISVAIGALISFLASIPSIVRTNMTNRSQRKYISTLESSVADQKIKLDATQKKLDDLQKPAAVSAAGENGEANPATEGGKKLWQG